ncbi:vWA domain-containing protein [Desulfobacterium sp. N47]|uniref:vWA domain-containing protein n=1 Tax=Desulfobacterium sp. N47 TaxID=3115210 RepID=UPI003CA9F9C0
MMFRFEYPAFFFLLLAVPALLFFVFKRKTQHITYSYTSRLSKIAENSSRMLARVPIILRALCLIFLVIAAARPQLYNISRDIRSSGVDIMLCLDTSGSMQALDFELDGKPVTRLTVVKKVVADFIKERETDRIGLVVFGQEAFTQSPLTMDKGLLLSLVDKMEIGMAGDSTAIGNAIAVAGKRLKDLKAKSKIMIILTDGRSNTGDITPEEAAGAAAALGIKIYTIGVGGTGPAPFKVNTFFGPRIVNQSVDLDEKTLKEIAAIGKGKYFRATDSKELANIYEIINKAEKTEVKVKEFFNFKELYYYFLITAIVLLLLELILKTTVLRIIP